MRRNELLARHRVLTLAIVSAMGTGITTNRSALADLTPAPQTLLQSIDSTATSDPTTSTTLWRIPHEGTRRDKRPASDGSSLDSFSSTYPRPSTSTSSPTNLTIQDQSLGYQNLYADDDFQNLGDVGWVQTDQPPLANGETSPQLQLNTTPVPLPGAVWLGALGLGSFAWIRKRAGS